MYVYTHELQHAQIHIHPQTFNAHSNNVDVWAVYVSQEGNKQQH